MHISQKIQSLKSMLVMNQKGLQGNPILIALVPSYNHAELKESVWGGGGIFTCMLMVHIVLQNVNFQEFVNRFCFQPILCHLF